MALTPAPVVVAPEPRALRYGLFTAATGPVDLPSLGGMGGGVRYEPVSCGRAYRYPVECDDSPPSKVFDPADTYVDAAPFVVYSSLTCGSVGQDAASIEAKVRRRLANGEQAQVEAELSDLLVAAPQVVTSSDPGDIVSVVAELEEWLYDTSLYGNVGVIHAPIAAAELAQAAGIVVESKPVPGLLTTRLGTAWSFGNYVPGVIHITGSVTVYRSPDVMVPPPEQTFDRTTNQWHAIAEREYAVAWDCLAAQAIFTPDTLS